jgi:general secretion pathway protein L
MRDSAQKLGLAAFWRWWQGQLVPLVPAAPRTAVRRLRIRPVLAFGAEAAVLWEPRVTDGVLAFAETARIPLAGDPASILQAGHAAVDRLPRRAYGGAVGAARVVLALPPGKILRKQLTFPAAVEENLRQVVAYDLDRHTPFRPEDLYFDAVVVGRDPVRKDIRVDLAAALKSVVDPARRQAESWGATVVAVTPDLPDPGSAMRTSSKLNLLPPADRPESAAWKRWQWWLPAAALAIALLAAVALPIWQKRDFVIALSGVVEEARKRAAESDALRGELEQLAADYNFVLGRKYAFPGAVQLLDDVSKLLPDDTWLTQFEVKSAPKGKEPHREVLLRGESANAGQLVSLLEESKLFEQAAPRSPTTKIQPPPGEIFDLGAQLKPLAAPATVELNSATVPAAPAAGAAAAPPAAPAAVPAAASSPTTEPAAAVAPAPAAAKAVPNDGTAAPAPTVEESEAPARGRSRRATGAGTAFPPAAPATPASQPAQPPAPAPAAEGDKAP